MGDQSRHLKLLGKLFFFAVLLQAVNDLLWSNFTHKLELQSGGKPRELWPKRDSGLGMGELEATLVCDSEAS